MSTHVAGKSRRRVVLRFLAFALFAIFVILSRMNSTNVAQTRPDHSDAILRTRNYRAPLAHVAAVVKLAIPTLKSYGRSWKLTEAKAQGDDFKIRAQIAVIVFTDDLQVTIRENKATRQVSLDVRSASRVGRGDLGENRRHIIQLLRAVDAQLASQNTR